jgi:hypothetical protein
MKKSICMSLHVFLKSSGYLELRLDSIERREMVKLIKFLIEGSDVNAVDETGFSVFVNYRVLNRTGTSDSVVVGKGPKETAQGYSRMTFYCD